jgi:hypothetical protein
MIMSGYIYKHKPTNKWVLIKLKQHCSEFEQYGNEFEIELVEDAEKATCYITKELLKEDLLDSSFANSKNYVKENFLEFELYNKIFSYTLEKVQNDQ